jgi:GrpB-like predicted nucleotidyltransferase (UPF0157 family)
MSKPKQTIIVVDYDPSWSQTFLELKEVLQNTLQDNCIAIEHVGSTSIPNLAAKPIIDLNVVIASSENLPKTIELLATLGYEHEGDLGVKNREAFKRLGEDIPKCESGRTWPNHYLYVCPQESLEHARQILFRDFLRSHPKKATKYGDLKRKLAALFPHDICKYTDGKKQLVEEVILLARQQLLE